MIAEKFLAHAQGLSSFALLIVIEIRLAMRVSPRCTNTPLAEGLQKFQTSLRTSTIQSVCMKMPSLHTFLFNVEGDYINDSFLDHLMANVLECSRSLEGIAIAMLSTCIPNQGLLRLLEMTRSFKRITLDILRSILIRDEGIEAFIQELSSDKHSPDKLNVHSDEPSSPRR